MDLYGHHLSAPTREVRILCQELGIKYQLIPVKQDPDSPYLPEVLDPMCRVPMIDDEGFYLSEVHAIQRYLAAKKPSPWYPEQIARRALVDQWLAWQGLRLAPQCGLIVYHRLFANTGPQAEPLIEQALGLLHGVLPELNSQLDRQAYLCGESPTLADIAVSSSLTYLEMARIDLAEYPATLTWWQKLKIRVSWQKTAPENER